MPRAGSSAASAASVAHFGTPPQVRATKDGFVVRSAERHYLLVADAYGAVLHSATAQEFEQAPTGSHRPCASMARPCISARAASCSTCRPATSRIAANAHTLAITSPWTHAIRLLPLA